MPFGTVKVGQLTLTELLRPVSEKGGTARTLAVQGQESFPPLTTEAELIQRHSDVVALDSSVVPVVFSDKADRSAYYRVTDSSSSLERWAGDKTQADWQLSLTRLGSDVEVDLESRLSGPVSRSNDFAVVGERTHTPPLGHYAYSAGTTLPTTMTRVTADGTITVYRNVPTGTHPRWSCPLASYLTGRVRFLDSNSFERSGVDIATTATGWQVHNGLVRVRPVGTILEIGCWDPELANWSVKNYNIQINGTSLGTPTSMTLLRNEPEVVVVRLIWAMSVGRTTADFTLRRGFRFTEVYVETQTSSTIKIVRGVVEAATAGTGYITATANDTDGNRYWLASLKTFTGDVANGAISKAATTGMSAAIGAVVGGSAAVSGDAAVDLMKQLVGTVSERVEAIRR